MLKDIAKQVDCNVHVFVENNNMKLSLYDVYPLANLERNISNANAASDWGKYCHVVKENARGVTLREAWTSELDRVAGFTKNSFLYMKGVNIVVSDDAKSVHTGDDQQ